MKFFFSEGAEKDLEESENYYNEEQFGLGEEFLDEVYSSIKDICKNPSVWQYVYKDLQRYSTDRFPFQMIFRLKNNFVEIIAISHNKRHPKHWLNK